MEAKLVLVEFRIRGDLRFLSHAETARLFQRACIRAGINISYSQGFNPRPQLSLPLPKSVGLELDNDLLCLWMLPDKQTLDCQELKEKLSAQLPTDCCLLSVAISQAKTPVQPETAVYVFAMKPEYLDNELKTTIDRLMQSENLNLDRRIDDIGNIRNVNVRPFLEGIQIEGENIKVNCRISQSGSIRVDEILTLLKLDIDKLAWPIRRTNIHWRQS